MQLLYGRLFLLFPGECTSGLDSIIHNEITLDYQLTSKPALCIKVCLSFHLNRMSTDSPSCKLSVKPAKSFTALILFTTDVFAGLVSL